MARKDLSPAEQRAQTYSAAMDSVNLINGGKGPRQSDENWVAAVKRNVEHLEIQVAKEDFWQGEDLAPLNAAIAAGKVIAG